MHTYTDLYLAHPLDIIVNSAHALLTLICNKKLPDMIREIPLQYDLENPVVELKFQAQLSRIVNHYDSFTPAEEAEAVNILMEKINNPTVFNWLPVFKEMATGCDVPLPVSTVDDFRFVLMACYEDARRTKARVGTGA